MGDFARPAWRAPRCPTCRSSVQVEFCNDVDYPWVCLGCMEAFSPARQHTDTIHDPQGRV